MQLVSFKQADEERTGVVVGDEVIDLSAADRSIPSEMIGLLEMGELGLDAVREAMQRKANATPLGEVELAAPVRPRKFFAIGLNYADHVAEIELETPERLTVFAKAITCVTGPFDQINRPLVSDQLDYEGELGFVIGRRCRHVSAERAAEVIGGFLIVNDVSVRDWQTMTPQWSLGKSFDTHGPIGPWIVTPDQLGDPHNLDIRTFVNDELRQSSNTRNLIFDCFEQVEILSKVCTLEPGDVIATGTPGGVAAAREGQPWLVPGDRVRVEVEGIGAIENGVVQEAQGSTEGALDADYAADPAAR